MAKRGSRNAPQGDSKRGLIVTLVFFVLATIGLGVGTYYGFADKEKLVEDKKAAQQQLKASEQLVDFYRFQSDFMKMYIGVAPEDQARLAVDKQNFDSGRYSSAPGAASAKTMVDKLQGALPWDPTLKSPSLNGQAYDIFKVVKDQVDAKNTIQQQMAALIKEKDQALADAKRIQGEKAAQKMAFDTEVEKLKAINAQQLADHVKKQQLFTAQFQNINKDKFDKAIELADKLTQLTKDKQVLEKRFLEQQEKLDILELRLSKQNARRPEVIKPVGKVVRIGNDGRRAYIDLGSNDGLKEHVTFSVHGIATNGQPEEEPKGTVEVVDVGPRTSEVVITRMFAKGGDKDYQGRRVSVDVLSRENTDPVQRGDVIVNSTWNPNLKTHIAIAGTVDFIGDGTNHVETFVRNLEKQNIIVDAYMDPRDGSFKGPGISPRTDMLVLASAPQFAEVASAQEKLRAEKLLKQMSDLAKKAEENGLRQVKLRRFIEEVGYRVPKYAQRRP